MIKTKVFEMPHKRQWNYSNYNHDLAQIQRIRFCFALIQLPRETHLRLNKMREIPLFEPTLITCPTADDGHCPLCLAGFAGFIRIRWHDRSCDLQLCLFGQQTSGAYGERDH